MLPSASLVGTIESSANAIPNAAEVRGAAKTALLKRFFDPALVDYVYTADTAEAGRLTTAGLAEQGAAGSVYTARVKGTVPLECRGQHTAR